MPLTYPPFQPGQEMNVCGIRVLPSLGRSNEDTYTVCPLPKGRQYFGVFDGHGGMSVAQFCSQRLHELVGEKLNAGHEFSETSFDPTFSALDDEAASCLPNVASCGSTAVVALLSSSTLQVANIGDSRAVLCRGGVALDLTNDQRADRQDEADRIEACGGQILWNAGTARVFGILATTRAIGDRDLRECGVICKPEVTQTARTADDDFLLLASDGLFALLSSQDVVNIISRVLARAASKGASRESALRMAADVAARFARDKGSKDDITVIAVDLRQQLTPAPMLQFDQFGPYAPLAPAQQQQQQQQQQQLGAAPQHLPALHPVGGHVRMDECSGGGSQVVPVPGAMALHMAVRMQESPDTAMLALADSSGSSSSMCFQPLPSSDTPCPAGSSPADSPRSAAQHIAPGLPQLRCAAPAPGSSLLPASMHMHMHSVLAMDAPTAAAHVGYGGGLCCSSVSPGYLPSTPLSPSMHKALLQHIHASPFVAVRGSPSSPSCTTPPAVVPVWVAGVPSEHSAATLMAGAGAGAAQVVPCAPAGHPALHPQSLPACPANSGTEAGTVCSGAGGVDVSAYSNTMQLGGHAKAIMLQPFGGAGIDVPRSSTLAEGCGSTHSTAGTAFAAASASASGCMPASLPAEGMAVFDRALSLSLSDPVAAPTTLRGGAAWVDAADAAQLPRISAMATGEEHEEDSVLVPQACPAPPSPRSLQSQLQPHAHASLHRCLKPARVGARNIALEHAPQHIEQRLGGRAGAVCAVAAPQAHVSGWAAVPAGGLAHVATELVVPEAATGSDPPSSLAPGQPRCVSEPAPHRPTAFTFSMRGHSAPLPVLTLLAVSAAPAPREAGVLLVDAATAQTA